MHKINSRIVDPNGGIIRISVIGCGGTGSLFLPILARFAYALHDLFQYNLIVKVFDGDVVDEVNPCRQAFSPFEALENKAIALVSRINRFWNYSWEAIPEYLSKDSDPKIIDHFLKNRHIVITVTDNRKSRLEIEQLIKLNQKGAYDEHQTLYWLDMGNAKSTGNVLLTDLKKLKSVSSYYKRFKDRDLSVPSCSIAQSLDSQNILINQYMATIGAQLLWELLTSKELTWQGAFINAETLNIKKIKIAENKRRKQ